MDSLLSQKKAGPVTEIADAMVRKDSHDWESIYRLGISLVEAGKPDLAAERFGALLELANPDDELSAMSRGAEQGPQAERGEHVATRDAANDRASDRAAAGAGAADPPGDEPGRPRGDLEPSVADGLGAGDFGQARMASLAWLVALAEKKGKAQGEEVIARFRKAGEKTPAEPRAMWDWFYLSLLRYDNAGIVAAGKLLSQGAPNDPLALWAYLYSLGGRERTAGQRIVTGLNQWQPGQGHDPTLARGRAGPCAGVLPSAASAGPSWRRPRSSRSCSRS